MCVFLYEIWNWLIVTFNAHLQLLVLAYLFSGRQHVAWTDFSDFWNWNTPDQAKKQKQLKSIKCNSTRKSRINAEIAENMSNANTLAKQVTLTIYVYIREHIYLPVVMPWRIPETKYINIILSLNNLRTKPNKFQLIPCWEIHLL